MIDSINDIMLITGRYRNAGIPGNAGHGSQTVPVPDGNPARVLSKDEKAIRRVISGVFECLELFFGKRKFLL